MTALAADRRSPRLSGDLRKQALAASVKVFNGGILMRNASGYLTKGQTALGLVGVGVANEQVDNSAGAAGDKKVEYREGIYPFANSSSADAITIADIGKVCFAVDDQTVAKTDGRTSGLPTRSAAGIVVDAIPPASIFCSTRAAPRTPCRAGASSCRFASRPWSVPASTAFARSGAASSCRSTRSLRVC